MSKPYNILFLNETSGPGGAETVIYNIVKNLDHNRYLPKVGLFCQGWFVGHLADNGISVEVIPSKRSWDISFLFKIMKFCKENKIDLIHAHLPGANFYGSLAGKFLGIPVICTFHNEILIPGFVEHFTAIKYFAIRHLAARLVMVAMYMQGDYLTKAKLPAEKIITIYNGVPDRKESTPFDVDSFRKAVDYHDGDVLIANVANFRGPKGHNVIVEAANIIKDKFPKAKILLIGDKGDGVIKTQTESHIKKLGLENNLKILGFRNDVCHVLRNIDIFMLASISEGLPISVVEAMMASRPIIATDVGGLSEIVNNGVSGFLVKPNDPIALADKIIELAADKQLRIDMGNKGYQIAKEKLSVETMIAQYQNLYEELLAK
jgi:glycosyltransferase involved in cell wall biosynthesis